MSSPRSGVDQGMDDEERPGDEAVHPERGERPGPEVAGEEPDGRVGGQAGHEAAGQYLAPARLLAERPGQVSEFVEAGGEDDRGGQEKRKLHGIFVVEAPYQT